MFGGFVGFVVVAASDTLLNPPSSSHCTTPATYGWDYQAIGYDIVDDDELAQTQKDMRACSTQGQPADDTVVSPDGVRLDGWYIPAERGEDSASWTVVLVHGWTSDKSQMLSYARELHDQFNLVVLDLRSAGRSSRAATTAGLREAGDVRSMVDWLVETRHPEHIALMGVSMGAASAAREAAHDDRIGALIPNSAHAHAEDVIGAILTSDHGVPALLAGPVLAAASLRIGEDIAGADPVRSIAMLGRRPLLITHGTADRKDDLAVSAQVNVTTAQAAGVPVTAHYCEGGGHAQTADVCAGMWGRWVEDFLDNAAGD